MRTQVTEPLKGELRVKRAFTWTRDRLSTVVLAGAPVEYSTKNQVYYVKPSYFKGIMRHDAEYYGCYVGQDNVETKPKRITLATFKKFINENRAELLIKVESKFDGMTDGVENVRDSFHPAVSDGRDGFPNTLGIAGVWLVGESRDYFTRYYNEINGEKYEGIDVYNCCGSFIVAKKVS